MDVEVLTDIEIERPRSEVADYVSDPDNATAWYENIKKVEWKSPKALKVGAKVAFEARFMGRKMATRSPRRRAARRSWSCATGAARRDSGPSSPPRWRVQ